MATQVKHFSLVLLVLLLAATCFSCASASDLRGFGGGRKLLQQLSGITLASNVTRGEEDFNSSSDTKKCSRSKWSDNLPLPHLLKLQVRELKGLEALIDIHADYTPANTHSPDNDYPPPGEYSSKTVGFHADYAPATYNPPDNDFPPHEEYSPKTIGFHTDYAPVTTHPPDYDSPPPSEYSSKTVNFHTDYSPVTTHPPDYDYPPPGKSTSIET